MLEIKYRDRVFAVSITDLHSNDLEDLRAALESIADTMQDCGTYARTDGSPLYQVNRMIEEVDEDLNELESWREGPR